MTQLVHLSAAEMARRIRLRHISPVELVKAHLAAIQELNPQLNAFVEIRAEDALKEAKSAEFRIAGGEQVGSLHGVPISIKSSIAVAGCKHEAGSPTRRDIRADNDATLVKRLRDAGAIVLGLTNTPEMLMAYDTDNPLYGRTNSPWDLKRTPGGSSGGEAAAIASGISAGGVGSDGGGSIRVPAHFSGICGLKPTPGRIPATGHFPESLGPFAALGVVGPMGRTVEDTELLFRVMAGFDSGDTSATPVELAEIPADELRKVRIGYFEDHDACPVTPETKLAVRLAVKCLKQAGFDVIPFEPQVLEQAREHWWTLFVQLGGELILPIFEGREHETSSILRYARNQPQPSKQQLLNAWFGRDQLRLQLFREMAQTPIIICPACAVPAFRHEERQWIVDGQSIDYMQAMMYTQWFNLLGNPAAVVPITKSVEGLPMGVQVVGLPYREELILKIAAVIESAGGFKAPPLSA
jgi:Asp-tRNA(Asn)/Glu-tRNA(Gln) amidotransferase A subunit family amidase